MNGSKWRFSKDNTTTESDNEGTNIDSELELEESTNVVEDVSSPHASLDNGSEVIVLDKNVRSSVSNLSTGLHSETDISFL